jgi:hypothetical protein
MGGNGPEKALRGLDFLEQHRLLGPRTMYVQANHYTDDALRRIADSGDMIASSSVVEVELGFGAPITARALAAGIPTGSSTRNAMTTGTRRSRQRTRRRCETVPYAIGRQHEPAHATVDITMDGVAKW